MTPQGVMSPRDLLLKWIEEIERSADRMRDLSRHCKAEAQKLEERAMHLRLSLPPEPDKGKPDEAAVQ